MHVYSSTDEGRVTLTVKDEFQVCFVNHLNLTAETYFECETLLVLISINPINLNYHIKYKLNCKFLHGIWKIDGAKFCKFY